MTEPTPEGRDAIVGDEPVLDAALRTPPLNPERLERLRAIVEREWRAATADVPTVQAQRRVPALRRRWVAMAAAASVVAVAVTLWIGHSSTGALSIGSMSGGPLRVGDRLTAQGPVLVSLSRGGTLRIAAGSRVAVIAPSRLSLERGLIYVDIPPGPYTGSPLQVVTKAGAVEHVGTEFEVMSDDHAVRVRVREGRVRFLGKTDTIVADAGTELLAAPDKPIVQRPIDTYGRDWSWTTALAPDFEIEGRPLIGFLQWVSRELGRPLNFADANARRVADRTILHGSVRHQAPIDAMSNVLATTSLTYEIRGETIWVRSGTSTAL